MYEAVDLIGVGQPNVRKLLDGNKDICRIEEGLLLGSAAVARDRYLLKISKVTHILTVAAGLAPLYPNDFVYKVIEVVDNSALDLTRYFDDCFNFIKEAKKSGGGVLIHCLRGVSRSVTIVVAYLMKKRGMSFSKAMEHVKSQQPQAAPNLGFISQLQRFEKSIQEQDVNRVKGFSQNPDMKVKWTEHKSRLLLQLIVREQQKKNWKGTYLNKAGKQNVCSEFRRVTKHDLPWKKFKSRLDHLRRRYDLYKKVTRNVSTELRINPRNGILNMDKIWWDERIKEFPEAAKLLENPLCDINLLDEIFGAVYACGFREWNPTAGSDQIDSHLDENTDPSEEEGQGDSEEIEVSVQNPIPVPAQDPAPVPAQDPTQVPAQDPTTPMARADRLILSDHHLRALQKRASLEDSSDQLTTSYEERTRVLEPGRERYKRMKPYSIPVAMDQLHELKAVVHGSRLYWKAIELFETSEAQREMFLSFKTDSLRIEYLERKTGVKRYDGDEGS